MDAQACLQKMKLAGTLALATVDTDGSPQIRCVSAVHYEPDAIYFFTARGKEMVRMSGTATPAAEAEQAKWIDTIFAEQPYLANVYPGDTREIGIVFEVRDITLDYFNLGVHPIERAVFSLDKAPVKARGYRIDPNACIGCGTCLARCPQKCIAAGDAYRIEPEHCLHCGACFENCPAGAVERL